MALRQQTGALPKLVPPLCILVAFAAVIFGLGLAAFSNRGLYLIPSVVCVGGGVLLALLMLPEWLSHDSRVEYQADNQVAEPLQVADALSSSISQGAESSCDAPRQSAVLIPFPTRSKK